MFRLQANTMEEFQSMVQFFGEDPKKTTTTEIFGIFADFITKFEVTIAKILFYTNSPNMMHHKHIDLYNVHLS